MSLQAGKWIFSGHNMRPRFIIEKMATLEVGELDEFVVKAGVYKL